VLIALVVVVVGLAFLAGGIVYYALPAHSLPSFFPSHTSATALGAGVHHTKKGLVGVVIGAVLLVAGAVVALLGTSRRAGAGGGRAPSP
jgi:hypothetical protein